jgi:hypothetical protein
VQYRPTAVELLDVVAELLETEVLPAVSGPLQHRVRVAGHLSRMVQRELDLAEPGDAAERSRLATILDDPDADLGTLRAALRDRLLDPEPLERDLAQQVREALVATARTNLAICKPGYDRWEGG